jgi:uncharacterized membrane protein
MCGCRRGGRPEYSSGGTRPNWNDIMTSATGLQCKTYALLVPIVVSASTGNVLLGKGMRQIGEIPWSLSALGGLFVKTFSNGWVWLGIGSLLLFLVSFMVVLSWADYSFVMPASAASYAAATLMSHWLLGESVTPQRWAGVTLICVGVALVTRTPSSSRG